MSTTCSCGAGHPTYGSCLRAKGIRIGYCQDWKGNDYTRQKAHQAELDLYRSAREQGVQPAGTSTMHTRAALEISDRTGVAFDASFSNLE